MGLRELAMSEHGTLSDGLFPSIHPNPLQCRRGYDQGSLGGVGGKIWSSSSTGEQKAREDGEG